MGPDFRFATFLLARGEIRNGVLEGDLILYGTGDPSMADRLLDSAEEPFVRFARELKSQGIHTVRGNILGDGTFFNGPSRRDSWNPRDLNDWFAAPISALSFNENLVTLRIQPGAGGGPPEC
jgi:serine-type D-Ala-D-Ala carboxypeptidase/endopeptidase (penicillin-binding protein 4)